MVVLRAGYHRHLDQQPDYKKVRNYWKWLKNKLNAEGSQLVSATYQLKLVAAHGKRYNTDGAGYRTGVAPNPVHPLPQG